MEIPTAFLQGAIFSKDRPQYMNFGAAGSVFGHEITHGFDTKGRFYNWEGNLENWWQPEADTKYTCLHIISTASGALVVVPVSDTYIYPIHPSIRR